MGNFNLDVTLKKALEEFKSRSSSDMVWKTGAEFLDGSFNLNFLGMPIEVSFPEGTVYHKGTGEELGLVERILILHYFTCAGGTPLLKRDISYKELPGGSIYIEPFTNRCIRPLIQLFGKDLTSFGEAAEKCGGTKQKYGDMSYCFYPLPRIPITLVIWAADDEFPANANIIFDASASDYLHTEDYAFLCSMLLGKLKGSIKK